MEAYPCIPPRSVLGGIFACRDRVRHSRGAERCTCASVGGAVSGRTVAQINVFQAMPGGLGDSRLAVRLHLMQREYTDDTVLRKVWKGACVPYLAGWRVVRGRSFCRWRRSWRAAAAEHADRLEQP